MRPRNDSKSDSAAWNPPATIVRPNPTVRARYDDLYARYRDLYPASRKVVHALARQQNDQGGQS